MAAVGPPLATAVRNAVEHDQVGRAAATDALTGLRNSAAFLDWARRELERCRLSGHGATIVFMDVDYFKELNDRFGHLQGNVVLRRLGEALRNASEVRRENYEAGMAARFGGDEFALLWSNLSPATETSRLNRIREALSSAASEVSPECKLSLSIGLARFPADGGNLDELLETADRRVYADKESHHSRSARAPLTVH